MKLVIKRSDFEGYDLLHNGERVARVVKRSRYYNIAPRPLTVHWWHISSELGYDDGEHHSTRRDAIAAVQARIDEMEGEANGN